MSVYKVKSLSHNVQVRGDMLSKAEVLFDFENQGVY